MKHQLLLIEDDAVLASVLKSALQLDGFDLHVSQTGEDGVAVATDGNFDVAIVDLRLPGMHGLDVVRILRERLTTPIVILTAQDDTHDVVAGLEAGADDFLSKPIATKELTARLRALLRRFSRTPTFDEKPFDNEQKTEIRLEAAGISVDHSTYECQISGVSVQLTKTEFRVLAIMIENKNKVVSRTQFLEWVWGYDYLGDSRLVDTQIHRLRAKIREILGHDPIETIRGVGFKLIDRHS